MNTVKYSTLKQRVFFQFYYIVVMEILEMNLKMVKIAVEVYRDPIILMIVKSIKINLMIFSLAAVESHFPRNLVVLKPVKLKTNLNKNDLKTLNLLIRRVPADLSTNG